MHSNKVNFLVAGQRLAAEKGQSDDLVGAMNAQETARQQEESDSEDEN